MSAMGIWKSLFGEKARNKAKKPKASVLKKEIGGEAPGGIRTIQHSSVALGLTPQRLASVLIGANEGNVLDYLTLAEEMEERDLHYAGVLGTRKNAVLKLDVKVTSPTDEKEDLEITDQVRDMLKQITLRKVMHDLLDAFGKSYSAVEIVWDTSGSLWMPAKLVWRDPRFFQFDPDTLSELRLRDMADPINGLELSPYKWIVHYPQIKTGIPIRGGLARLASFAHMAKSYGLKDWISFAEVYGMPLRVGRYPPSATAEDQSRLLTAVANLGTDAAAILPETMKLEFVTQAQGNTGGAVFRELADYLDKQVSKGVLGQTMTTDDGSSLGQAKVHEQVREDIVESDAACLAETLSGFVQSWVLLNYGVRKRYPCVEIKLHQQEDLVGFSQAAGPMIDRGLRVEASQVLDKFGLVEAEEGAEILHPEGKSSQSQEPKPFSPQGQDQDQEPVTTEQRRRALMVALQRSDSFEDAVDVLVELGLKDWERQTDPMLRPILDLADKSESFEEFAVGLDKTLSKMDTELFVKRLATAMFMGHGLGDATDKV